MERGYRCKSCNAKLKGSPANPPDEFFDLTRSSSVPVEPKRCGVRGYLTKSSRVAPIAEGSFYNVRCSLARSIQCFQQWPLWAEPMAKEPWFVGTRRATDAMSNPFRYCGILASIGTGGVQEHRRVDFFSQGKGSSPQAILDCG